jgi:hypothetical protein
LFSGTKVANIRGTRGQTRAFSEPTYPTL